MSETDSSLETVRRIVLEGLKGHPARVILFGSRAKRKPRGASDVDIGILPEKALPAGLLSLIREKLEESSVTFFVDLVDLSQTEPAFRERVQKEGILWNG